MREPVDQREGAAVGETRQQHAVCGDVIARRASRRGSRAGRARRPRPTVEPTAVGATRTMPGALGVAHPRPQEVASVPGAAVERDDHRPGPLLVVVFRYVEREAAVMTAGRDARERRAAAPSPSLARRCRAIGRPVVAERRQHRAEDVEVLLRLRVMVERGQDARDPFARRARSGSSRRESAHSRDVSEPGGEETVERRERVRAQAPRRARARARRARR